MPADAPTILATSGGRVAGRRTPWEVGPLTEYAVELARVSGRRPRVGFLATALGDSAVRAPGVLRRGRGSRGSRRPTSRSSRCPTWTTRAPICSRRTSSGCGAGASPGCWRCGAARGSTPPCARPGGRRGPAPGSRRVHLLARRRATDSFARTCARSRPGWRLLPSVNGVHYDSEEQRRAAAAPPGRRRSCRPPTRRTTGSACTTGGPSWSRLLTEVPDKAAYRVERGPDGEAVETDVERPRLLRRHRRPRRPTKRTSACPWRGLPRPGVASATPASQQARATGLHVAA